MTKPSETLTLKERASWANTLHVRRVLCSLTQGTTCILPSSIQDSSQKLVNLGGGGMEGHDNTRNAKVLSVQRHTYLLPEV